MTHDDDPDWLLAKHEAERKRAETPPSDPVLAQIWHLDRNLGKVRVKDIGLLQRMVGRLQWLAWALVVMIALILWRVW